MSEPPGARWAPLPLVYQDRYVVPLPPGHRFPMAKFGLLYRHLQDIGLATADNTHAPGFAPRRDLLLAHDPAYIDAILHGSLSRRAERQLGLPWSRGLAERSQVAVAGTTLTVRLALEHGLAANCAGGTHHAFRDHGTGFCVFNDMAVAALVALRDGWVRRRVLVLDLDVHQGDGTAAILAREPRVVTVSVHARLNFPFHKQRSDLDLALPDGVWDEAYLALLEGGVTAAADAGLTGVEARVNGWGAVAASARPGEQFAGVRALFERLQPELLIYDAGVDPHRDDPLGRLSLSDAGLYARDRLVIATARAMGIPVACVIGGGYSGDHAAIARRHATVHRAAAAVLAAADASMPSPPPQRPDTILGAPRSP